MNDFVEVSSQTLTIAAQKTSRTFTVRTDAGDDIDDIDATAEGTETFGVTITLDNPPAGVALGTNKGNRDDC